MKIAFFLDTIPVAKGRPRFTKRGFSYTPEKTRIAESNIIKLCESFKPAKPIETAVSVLLSFNVPIPQSYTKIKREAICNGELHPLTRPDLDNYAKLVLDAMNEIFYKDDSQIIDLVLSKRYAIDEKIGIGVVIKSEEDIFLF